MIVENVTGAAGNVATERVAKAAPDGYTLLAAASATIVTNPSLYAKLNFDPVKDFAPITQIVTTPNLLVVPNDLPVKSVAELVAYAKAQSGNSPSARPASAPRSISPANCSRPWPASTCSTFPIAASPRPCRICWPDGSRWCSAISRRCSRSYREGKARALAVTSPRRWPSVPELPTMIELGFKDFDSSAWFGLMAPAGTPQPIIDRLHQETVRILARADVRERFDVLGMEPIGNTPAEFAAVIAAETPQWAKVIKDAGIKAGE